MNNFIKRFKKYRDGGKQTAVAASARRRNKDTRKVDMSTVTEADNLNKKLFLKEFDQLQDSLIARNYPFAQRMAILASAFQEGSPTSKGVGGNGILGLSSQRMPVSLLDDYPAQITWVLDDLEQTHEDNWLDGGSGGITIKTGRDGHNMFWNTNNIDSATVILNKSYIRPSDPSDWSDRTKVAINLSNKAK